MGQWKWKEGVGKERKKERKKSRTMKEKERDGNKKKEGKQDGVWRQKERKLVGWLGFILFTNPSARAGYDTRSIFKRSSTGFNSEFSFS